MIIRFLKENLRFSSPLAVCIVVAVGVVWLYRRPGSAWPKRYLTACLTLYFLITTPLGAGVLVGVLGYGYTRVASPADARGADAVVVLGGGGWTTTVGGQTAEGTSMSTTLRVLEGARVFKAIGARFIVVSGGIPYEDEQHRPESRMMRDVLVAAGLPAEAVIEESESKTTRDEARLMGPLLAARGVRQFVLVTSPTHMRRSLILFRVAGLDPIPDIAPVRSDDRVRPMLMLPNEESLWLADNALYDCAAWAYYWWNGWTRPAVQ